MVYSSINWRYLLVAIIIVGLGVGTLFYTTNIFDTLLRGRLFLSQVPLSQVPTPQEQAAALIPLANILNILDKHQASPNNHQVVQRSQTAQRLLDAVIKEL